MDINVIGIIAGDGELPRIATNIFLEEGNEILFLDISREGKQIGDELVHYHHLNPGQLGKAMKLFKRYEVDKVLFAGKVEKGRLFKDVKPDLRAVKLLTKMKFKGDREITDVLIKELEGEGITTLTQTDVFKDYIVDRSLLTDRKIPNNIKKDIEEGYRVAKEIANIGLGQTVVIKDGVITATESIEGTNKTIERGAHYAGEGFTVVKVASDDHDTRFDLPTVGPDTIKLISSCGGVALVVEEGLTILLDGERVVEYADEKSIHILGFYHK